MIFPAFCEEEEEVPSVSKTTADPPEFLAENPTSPIASTNVSQGMSLDPSALDSGNIAINILYARCFTKNFRSEGASKGSTKSTSPSGELGANEDAFPRVLTLDFSSPFLRICNS